MGASFNLDPAVVDRRTSLLVGIDPGSLPRRRMTIAGMEGALDAVTLSKDQKGPATRLVEFGAGWGSGVSGAFTEDVEVFVVEGELTVGRAVIGPHDYARIPGRGVFGGLRALTGGRALLMTEAPVRYDTASGGGAAQLEIVHSGDISWKPDAGSPGRFIKQIDAAGVAMLVGMLEWKHAGPWHSHDVGEEMFVVEGEVTIVDWVEQNPSPWTYRPDGYVWRPAGSIHGGPGSRAPDAALAFVRRPGGPGATAHLDEPAGSEGSPGQDETSSRTA